MSQQNIGNQRHSQSAGWSKGISPSTPAELRERILCGYVLPTTEQLLRGFPFMEGELGQDMKNFAKAFLREMESKDPEGRLDDLQKAFSSVLTDGSLPSVRLAAELIRDADISSWSPEARDAKLRCWIYAVHLGDVECIVPVTVSSIAKAYQQDWATQEGAADIVWWMLGLLTVYANDVPELFLEPTEFMKLERVADRIATAADQYRNWMSAHLLSCDHRKL